MRRPEPCVEMLESEVDETLEKTDTSDRPDRPDIVRWSGESCVGVWGMPFCILAP